jgi:transposase
MASRRKFSPEYRAEAVALVVESGRSVADVAKSLNIHENTLGNWLKQAKDRGEVAGKPLSLPERAELEELRRRNEQLQMDVDFLGKAAAWFASRNK